MPESRRYRYHTLDVFTSTGYCGNPLAVFPDAEGLSTDQMQRIANELHLSESVFLFPPSDPAHTRKARIFTPGAELPFAGHPTVGTAFLLASMGLAAQHPGETLLHVVLEEGVGPVRVVVKVENGAPVAAQLTAAEPPEFRDDVPTGHALADLLCVRDEDVDTAGLPPQAVSCGVPYLIAPLATREAVSRSRLRHDAWERLLAPAWAQNVFVVAADDIRAGGDQPIRARMYAPELGVVEDPATGSAAVAFAGYLAVRDDTADGTLHWTIEQGVEMGRPSTLRIEAEKRDGGIAALRVAGAAVLVGEGELTPPAG